jgi:hypothetical protein
MTRYVYGYIIYANGERKRVELGTISQSEYRSKKAEIDSANFVAAGGLGGLAKDKNVTYFIEEI